MTTTTAPLVGLIARKRAGKDSFAARLVSEHGFARYAFADPLKATIRDLNPIVWVESDECYLFGHEAMQQGTLRLRTVLDLLGWEKAKELREVRRLLQAHGVAIREHVDPETWLRATMTRVEQERRLGVPVAVTDVRFPNEADAIEAAGGVLVRIHRPGLDTSDQHVSETALDGRLCPFHVGNSGTLDDLARTADDLAGILEARNR